MKPREKAVAPLFDFRWTQTMLIMTDSGDTHKLMTFACNCTIRITPSGRGAAAALCDYHRKEF